MNDPTASHPDVPVVWKFMLPGPGPRHLAMPAGAEILSVAVQHENGVLWARVVPSRPVVHHRIFVVETGAPWTFAPEEMDQVLQARFVGTLLFRSGAYVVHVFDCGETTTPATVAPQTPESPS